MKYYIMAIVLIVAIAGFGVQFIGANTGMPVVLINPKPTTHSIPDTCLKLKMHINFLVAKFENAQCPLLGIESSELICAKKIKSGYAFNLKSEPELKDQQYQWVDYEPQYEFCQAIEYEAMDDVAELEKYSKSYKECGKMLYELQAPLGCSEKTRAY